jgi:hypothetical protein
MRISITVTGLAIEKAAVESAVDRLRNYTDWAKLIGEEAAVLSPLKQPVDQVNVSASTYPDLGVTRGE